MTLERKLIYPTKDTRAHAVIGPRGTVVLLWSLSTSTRYPDEAWDGDWRVQDLGFHSRTRPYYWSGRTSTPDCFFIGGDACWYDGTSIGANALGHMFLARGEELVYDELQAWYESRFRTRSRTR